MQEAKEIMEAGLIDQGWEVKGNSLLTGGYGRLNYLVNGYRDAHWLL